MKNVIVVIGYAAGLFSLALMAGCGGKTEEISTFDSQVDGEGNSIVVEPGVEATRFDIFSDSGIGSASIKLAAGERPKDIYMHFHVRGLEELRFTYDEKVITMNISSHQGNDVHQSIIDTSSDSVQAERIEPGSRYWMDVEVINSDGSPGTIPLEDGQIIVRAPDDFSMGEFTIFSIDWIDFYR